VAGVNITRENIDPKSFMVMTSSKKNTIESHRDNKVNNYYKKWHPGNDRKKTLGKSVLADSIKDA
jgi:hypothetical protein